MLVKPLFEGPIDIIGDIHGEAGPLFQLLDIMGYDGEGNHPEGRHLVFVGDLVDRGPDSVSVVLFVMQLVLTGKAQMVLGNHELNIMQNKHKHGNHWFYGETEAITRDKKEGPNPISFQRLATAEFREKALQFFRSLPLVLERPDVRVAHACWDSDAVQALRAFSASSPTADANDALHHFEAALKDTLAATADETERELIAQNRNPVKVTTSGKEERVATPFFAGGKTRQAGRSKWWDTYTDSELVVIGHYWRTFPRPAATPTALADYKPAAEDPFAGAGAAQPAGPAKSVVCVDFSVGLRYEERGKRLPPGAFGTHLVALRLPERLLVREDGVSMPLLDECPAQR